MNILQQIINFFTGKPSHADELLLKVGALAKEAETVLGVHNKELDYVTDHIKALGEAKVEIAKDAAKAGAVLRQLAQITDTVGTIAG